MKEKDGESMYLKIYEISVPFAEHPLQRPIAYFHVITCVFFAKGVHFGPV